MIDFQGAFKDIVGNEEGLEMMGDINQLPLIAQIICFSNCLDICTTTFIGLNFDIHKINWIKNKWLIKYNDEETWGITHDEETVPVTSKNIEYWSTSPCLFSNYIYFEGEIFFTELGNNDEIDNILDNNKDKGELYLVINNPYDKTKKVFRSNCDVDISQFILNGLKTSDRNYILDSMYESVNIIKFAEHVHKYWNVYKEYIIPDYMSELPNDWDNYNLMKIKFMLNNMIKYGR